MKRWTAPIIALLGALSACTPGGSAPGPGATASGFPAVADRAVVPCSQAIAHHEPGDPELGGAERSGFSGTEVVMVADPTRGPDTHFGKVGLIVAGLTRLEVSTHTDGLALNYANKAARTLVFDCAEDPTPFLVFAGGFLSPTAIVGEVIVTVDGQPVRVTLLTE